MDSVIKSEIHYQEHDGVLTHKTSQPTEGLILDRASEFRKTPGLLRDLGAGSEGGSWGRQVASIPFIMYEEAIREGFILNAKDQKYAAKEMSRFLQTPKGRTCTVQG